MADASAWGLKATALGKAGRRAEAEAVLREGLAALPGHRILQYALAIHLLAEGAFEEGWRLYESRDALPNGPKDPGLPLPRWEGQEIRSLLVLPEQGLGDQILFSRYLPLLAARGIAATVVAPPTLAGLFRAIGAEVVVADGPVRLPRTDAWCFVGSLPRLTGTTLFEPQFPAGPGGGGIGLMTYGGPSWRDLRSLPPEVAARLAPLGRSLHPDDTGFTSFEETVRLIEGLDLVITIDTSVANLAGCMGKPVWVLLRAWPDWRWGLDPHAARMFPSARLFRQPVEGDWQAVADAVLEAHARL